MDNPEFEPTAEQIEVAVAAFNERNRQALAHEPFEVTDVHAMAAALRAAFRDDGSDNETLQKIGAINRPTKVGKHQALNWVHLRQTIEALDAAGQRDAADTLVWAVWHEVNGVARAREYHRIASKERDEARAKTARLEAGIQFVIAICEQDATDQRHNGAHTRDAELKAYAGGRGIASQGIATHLRALIEPAPSLSAGENGR